MSEPSLFLFGTVVFLMVSTAALGPFLYAAHRVEKGLEEKRKKRNHSASLQL